MGKKKKNDRVIPKKVCADQVIQRLLKIQGKLKWALGLLAVGTVVSPVIYWGVVPGIAGLAILGMLFKQNQVEITYLIQKWKLM